MTLNDSPPDTETGVSSVKIFSNESCSPFNVDHSHRSSITVSLVHCLKGCISEINIFFCYIDFVNFFGLLCSK